MNSAVAMRSSASPFFSVCIPAYRAERYLRETLDSIAAQTWTEWEIVIVEDGSQDRTEEIVKEFAATIRQRVIYQRQEKNAGLAATRNVANTLATGNWIAFLDSDDLWLPDHLALCVKKIEAEPEENLLVFSGCIIFDSDTGAALQHRTPTLEQWADFPFSLHRSDIIIQPSSVVISRSALERTGDFDVSFVQCNDMEYWFRACRAGVKFAFSGAETMLYRKHGQAMSNRAAELIVETGRVHFVHREWEKIPLAHRRKAIRQNYWNAARINRRSRPLTALQEAFSGCLLPFLAFW